VPGQNGMYRWEMDGLKIAHMGDVGNPLTDAQIGFFEDVDILLALAGGYLTIELPDLMKMIHRVRRNWSSRCISGRSPTGPGTRCGSRVSCPFQGRGR
jgi:L-ascorbate metabolism protein UlaG (beta-lactamase superfamily)